MTRACRGVVLALVVLLSGCKVDLYSSLSEVDANQMLSLLVSSQVDAVKVADKSGGLTLQVEKNDYVRAVEILRQHGFPRRAWRSVDDLFPSGQLVTSPAQEQAKIQFLREQSLERMLNNIEGVIEANVVIAGPSADDSMGKETASPSVSVLVKYSPEVNLKAFSAQLKNLVKNGLPGVTSDRIALIIQPVNYRVIPSGNIADDIPQQTSPESKASVQTTDPATSVGVTDKSHPRISSTLQKAKQATVPGWSLLIFWLVSCSLVVLHSVYKRKRGSALS